MQRISVFFLVFFSLPAMAALIDFDGGGTVEFDAYGSLSGYVEEGFTIDIGGSSDCYCDWARISNGGLFPSEGDFLAVNGYEVSGFSLSVSADEAFDFNGLAISSNEHGWDPMEETLLSLHVEGFYRDGGSISSHLDGFLQNVWGDISFSGYTDLDRLVIRSDRIGSWLRLDSLAMNGTQVALPGTLVLWLMAVTGMAVARRLQR